MRREYGYVIAFFAIAIGIYFLFPKFRTWFATAKTYFRPSGSKRPAANPTTAHKGNDSGGVLTNLPSADY